MKALKFTSIMKTEYVDIEIPEIGDDQVLIKVEAVGICHSDIMALQGKHPYRIPPVITGHEFSGIIAKVGKNIKDFLIGDKVCVEPQIGCGKCINCKEGNYNLCNNKALIGVGGWIGAFAEYTVAYPSMCIKLPDQIGFEEAALLEPLSVGVHAVEMLNIPKDSNIAVLGCGTIGMMTLAAVMTKRPKKVFVSEISESKRMIAKKFGDIYALNPNDQDINTVIMNSTDGNGVDFVFVTVPVESVLQQAIWLTRKRGIVSIIAVFENSIDLDVLHLQQGERRIVGSSMYTIKDFYTAINYRLNGFLDFESLITKRIGFDELAYNIERLAKGDMKDEIKIIARF
jgi:L-iditol 2-dehydrogenase